MLKAEAPSLAPVPRTVEVEPAALPGPLEDLTEHELEKKRQISRVSTAALSYFARALTRRGFEWLLPVVFSKSTDPLWPDPGASIEKRVEAEIYGETVRTTQSMIIHKLVACSTAYPKLFILSPNVRIEKRERRATGWHTYEFTQLDFEIRGAAFGDVRRLVESAIAGLVSLARAKNLLLPFGRESDIAAAATPFKVVDREDLTREHGSAWEDVLPGAIRQPVWVTNIPREFYDFEDPSTGRWDNYDLFVPKYGEILSGARREWEYGRIRGKMERDGVKRENYALLLRLAREGRLRPSAGAGIGIERLVGWLVGAGHIGEVQPFPKVPGSVYEL